MHADHLSVEVLSAYVDDALADGERQAAEAHLRDCAACRGELAELRQTVALLRAVSDRPAPRSFRLPPGTDLAANGRSLVEGTPPTAAHRADRLLHARGPRVQPVWLRAMAGIAAALMVVVFVSDFVGGVSGGGSAASTASESVSAPAQAPGPGSNSVAAPQPQARAAAPDASSDNAARNVTGAGGAVAPQEAAAPSTQGNTAGAAAPSAPGIVAGAAPPPAAQSAADAAAPLSAPQAAQPDTAKAQAPADSGAAVQRVAPRPSSPGSVSAASSSVTEPRASRPPARPWLTPGRLTAIALGLLTIALLVTSFAFSNRRELRRGSGSDGR